MNKVDLAEEPQIHQLEEWLHGLNPTAPIVRSSRGDVPLESILNIGGFDLIGKEHILEEKHNHEPAHDADITAISIREDRPLNRGKFLKWLTEFVAMEGGDLLRYKGILHFEGLENRSILQGVHMTRELENAGPWPKDVEPTTELVFIGRRLMEDVIREGIRNCVAR
jgi:G3E family GTPase